MLSVDLVTGSPWTYAVIVGTIAGSGVVTPLPSEGMLAAAMSLAVAGRLPLPLVCLATSLGALLADLSAYGLGRVIGSRTTRGRRSGRTSSPRAEAAMRWLQARRGSLGIFVVLGRFVPGGTTAVGVSAGLLTYPAGRFAALAALGSVLWTAYGVALAHLGRALFPGNSWAATALTVGIAVGAGGLVIALRRTGAVRRTGARGRTGRRSSAAGADSADPEQAQPVSGGENRPGTG